MRDMVEIYLREDVYHPLGNRTFEQMCLVKTPQKREKHRANSLSLHQRCQSFNLRAVSIDLSIPYLICSAIVYSVLLSHHVSRLLPPFCGIFALVSV